MLIRILLILATLVALAGCAPKYRCNNFPQGSCRNMTQVYEDTGNGFRDYREEGAEGKSSKQQPKKESQIVVSNTVKGLNELQPGDPVLTKPKVLRVWVKPWEDKERDLNYSYLYIRVKDSTWTVLE